MNLLWLEDFLALAASGNFSRAAQERHSSQPAFSRRIRALEAWLGTALFDRSTQPAQLTQAGEWLRGVAQELVSRITRLPGEAQAVAQISSVTLRIASTHALSFTFLPGWLRSHEAATALGPVQLMSDVLQRCEALMLEGKVQFVLGHAHSKARGALDSDRFRSAQIGSDRLIAVSRPDAAGAPCHRLGGRSGSVVPVLEYTRESGLGRIFRAVLGRRLASAPVQLVLTAHLASVLRTMVLDGKGVAWLPETLIRDDLGQGRLVPAATTAWNIALEIRLYRDHALAGPAAEAFWSAAACAAERAQVPGALALQGAPRA